MYVCAYKFLSTWLPKEKRYEVESVMDSVHYDDPELAHVYYNTCADEQSPVWEYEDDNLNTPIAGYDPYDLTSVYLFMHKQKSIEDMISWKHNFDKKIASKCKQENMDNNRNSVIYMKSVQCVLDYVDRCIASNTFNNHSYGLHEQSTKRTVTYGSFQTYKVVINELDGSKLSEDQIQECNSLAAAKDAFDIASDDADTVVRIFGINANGSENLLFENNTDLLEKYQKEEHEVNSINAEEQPVVKEEQQPDEPIVSEEHNEAEPVFDGWLIRYERSKGDIRKQMYHDVNLAKRDYLIFANRGFPVDIIGYIGKKAVKKLCEHNKRM